jgi:hypothetical protein
MCPCSQLPSDSLSQSLLNHRYIYGITIPRSRRFNQVGTYTAIVSFGRRVPDKQYSPRLKTLKKSATTVRYTLVVQSSLDAKDALEVKLQSLMRLF